MDYNIRQVFLQNFKVKMYMFLRFVPSLLLLDLPICNVHQMYAFQDI